MTQKKVLVEAFNKNVFDFNRSNSLVDLQALLQMATFAPTNPNRIECRVDVTASRFSLEMPYDDFVKALDNILPSLKDAFRKAQQLDVQKSNAGPQIVSGTDTWQISINSPTAPWIIVGGCSHG